MIVPAGSALDNEVELMALVGIGDIRAFEELYDHTAGAAFNLAMRIVNDRGTAADVTQEAFLEVWRHRERYRPERGAPRSWLLGIVRNRAIDAYRLTTRTGGPPQAERWDTEQTSEDNVEDHAIALDEARALRHALGQLPDEQLTVMDLAYFDGLTQTEIANQLGIPLGTVKGRVRLALNHLQGSVPQLA
jgi:RNA polymerase sigma-70 factor (ECF subfamily)